MYKYRKPYSIHEKSSLPFLVTTWLQMDLVGGSDGVDALGQVLQRGPTLWLKHPLSDGRQDEEHSEVNGQLAQHSLVQVEGSPSVTVVLTWIRKALGICSSDKEDVMAMALSAPQRSRSQRWWSQWCWPEHEGIEVLACSVFAVMQETLQELIQGQIEALHLQTWHPHSFPGALSPLPTTLPPIFKRQASVHHIMELELHWGASLSQSLASSWLSFLVGTLATPQLLLGPCAHLGLGSQQGCWLLLKHLLPTVPVMLLGEQVLLVVPEWWKRRAAGRTRSRTRSWEMSVFSRPRMRGRKQGLFSWCCSTTWLFQWKMPN